MKQSIGDKRKIIERRLIADCAILYDYAKSDIDELVNRGILVLVGADSDPRYPGVQIYTVRPDIWRILRKNAVLVINWRNVSTNLSPSDRERLLKVLLASGYSRATKYINHAAAVSKRVGQRALADLENGGKDACTDPLKVARFWTLMGVELQEAHRKLINHD